MTQATSSNSRGTQRDQGNQAGDGDAERARQYGTRTIVFVDEVHRFNKPNRTHFCLMSRREHPAIGATTENPSFEIISRCYRAAGVRVEVAERGTDSGTAATRAARQRARPGRVAPRAEESALRKIAAYSSGDARSAYNVLEIAATLAMEQAKDSTPRITDAIVSDALQKRVLSMTRPAKSITT